MGIELRNPNEGEMEAKTIMSPAWNPESGEAFVAVSADHDH